MSWEPNRRAMTEQKQPLHVVGGTTHATEAELLRLRAEIDLRDALGLVPGLT